MSTFGGRFDEPSLDWISVDNFSNINLNSSIFFLSHLHTDHMEGLNSAFFDNLIKTDRFLYCSKVTERFLRKKRKECIYNKNIKPLEFNLSSLVEAPHEKRVQVTLIPAGHCPGSVMFLFESCETTVLYTGDFRLPPCDLPKYKALHNSDGEVKKIDAIYLDTTFAYPEYETFPSREKSKDMLIEIVKEWFHKGINNKVGIIPPANYGLEFLVLELAKAMKQKIYIRSDILLENYNCICEVAEFVTDDSHSTRIHLCKQSRKPFYCDICHKEQLVTKRIRPSAMIFNQQYLKSLNSESYGGIVDDSDNVLKLAYSNHCSLEELKGFLKYIARDGCKIHACVVNPTYGEKKLMDNLGVRPMQNTILSENNGFCLQNKQSRYEDSASIMNTPGKQDLNQGPGDKDFKELKPTVLNNNQDLVSSAKELFGLYSPPRARKFNSSN